jgi:hypothetical protein
MVVVVSVQGVALEYLTPMMGREQSQVAQVKSGIQIESRQAADMMRHCVKCEKLGVSTEFCETKQSKSREVQAEPPKAKSQNAVTSQTRETNPNQTARQKTTTEETEPLQLQLHHIKGSSLDTANHRTA